MKCFEFEIMDIGDELGKKWAVHIFNTFGGWDVLGCAILQRELEVLLTAPNSDIITTEPSLLLQLQEFRAELEKIEPDVQWTFTPEEFDGLLFRLAQSLGSEWWAIILNKFDSAVKFAFAALGHVMHNHIKYADTNASLGGEERDFKELAKYCYISRKLEKFESDYKRFNEGEPFAS